MKEHFQDYGIRKWAGNDLIELQSEPMEALQKLVEPYAPCIIQGCEVTKNDGDTITVGLGLVALQGKDYKGEDCVKIARFVGIANEKPPIYLTLECEPESRVYGDSQSKAIAYNYKAVATTQEPEVSYLEINAKENKRLVDTLGITQKLDREGGDASNVKVVSFTADTSQDHTNIAPGMTLKELFGKICRWLSELKALAFKEKVAKSDFDKTLTEAFDNKVDNTEAGLNGAINLLSESSATPKDNDFYISQYANGGTSNKTYWRRRMSALWTYIKGKLSSDTGVNISGNAATATTATKATQDSEGNVIKDTYAQKTSLPTGVWRSNNGGKNSSSATTTLTAKQACTFKLKWIVSSESNFDKLTITAAGTTLVNALSGERNGTIAETSLASGAAIVLTYSKDSSSQSGRDLGEISDFYITVNGMCIAITPFNIDTYFTVTHGEYFFSPVHNITAATTNLPGLMSATDKTKLDGIATGANKTEVDTALSATSTNPVQNRVIKTALDDKLSLSGGTMTGPIVYSSSSGNKTTNYISAGGGYGTGTGKNGLKLLWNWDSGGQAGVGVNLTGYQHETTFAAHQDTSGLCYFTFAKHAKDSSSYTRLAEIDKDGNFNTTGVVKENGTRVYSPNNKPPLATTSAAGLMSVADKTSLEYHKKIEIVGLYSLSEGLRYQWGNETSLYANKTELDGEPCIEIKMPAIPGTYFIIPCMSHKFGYYINTDSIWTKAGEKMHVFHRDSSGKAGYHNVHCVFMLVRLN